MNQLVIPYRPGRPATSRSVAAKGRHKPSSLILAFLVTISLPLTIAGYAGTLLITPYRLFMLAVLPYLLVRLFADKSLKAGPADLLVIMYGVWTGYCSIRNVDGGTQRAGQTFLETVGAYLLARVAIRSIADLLYVTRLLFIISMIAFALAIPEAITHKKFIMDWTSAATGIKYGDYSFGTDIRMGLRRPQAFFANPILYGIFCATSASFVWYTVPSAISSWIKSALILAATLWSLSSGPLLAINLQVLLVLGERVTRSIKGRGAIAIAAATLLTVSLDLTTNSGVSGIIVNHLTFNSGSAFNRILIWQYGTYNIGLHPIFGLDPDTWIRPSYMKPSCDDFWIAITMAGGIPCLIFLVSAMGNLLWKVGTLETDNLPVVYKNLRTAWIFAFLAFSFSGFSVMFFGALQPYFFFFLGLAGAIVVVYEEASTKSSGGRIRKPAVARRAPDFYPARVASAQ